MQTTLIKVGEGYELRTTDRKIGDEIALLNPKTPFIIAGAAYKRKRLSTGRTRQGYSGFFTFVPHDFVPGAADTVMCLDGLLEGPTLSADSLRTCVSLSARLQQVGRSKRRTVELVDGLSLVEALQRTADLALYDSPQAEPETKNWNGEGLPPEGVDIEVLWSSTTGEYVTAKVIGHDEGRAVYRFTSGERKGEYQAERAPGVYDFLPNIRPIRTAEQLAAEQREVEEGRIKEALRFYCVGRKLDPTTGPNITYAQMAQALYAAGARFPEAK